jgi:hypothetical protein
MLAGVSGHFLKSDAPVSVVARTEKSFDALRALGGNLVPMPVDYRDGPAFATALDRTIKDHGPLSLAVVWMHAGTGGGPRRIAQRMPDVGRTSRYFHVLGSAVADPSRPDELAHVRDVVCQSAFIAYRQVVLGFVNEPSRARWLTNDEISGGVLDAIAADRELTIVGTVTPWSARP